MFLILYLKKKKKEISNLLIRPIYSRKMILQLPQHRGLFSSFGRERLPIKRDTT